MTSAGPRRAAFFDVDETLIAVKSIFRFLEFQLAAQGRPPEEYLRAEQELRARAVAGAPREEVNRAYFRLFAGLDEAETAAHGVRWFEAECEQGELFHPPVLDAFRRHTAAGDRTVLVSGSFPACLDPLARYLEAGAVLCSRPEVRHGRYTGEILQPMIGAAKAAAVQADAAAHGIDLLDCYAYGDHISDLPVLGVVGAPVVVGDDPVLTDHAIRHGWTQLPTSVPLLTLRT